ncbi:uncharacterized protein LOC124910295 [Impatiens glandulifera]|uniref:uncharacterized protein LOC124910295 n=1 Tax=Impatiens glandulifera TaxID=253017 RepID=UPI001FB06B3C|nr:uncharacterized protein LOC124910295 [Impatiens glandulifera]
MSAMCAQLGAGPSNATLQRCSQVIKLGRREWRKQTTQPSIVRLRLSCTMSNQEKKGESRRLFSISIVFLHFISSAPHHVMAGTILDKYLKRKKLDPLETYVPAVILTQIQIKELGKSLEASKPEYSTCRNVLRSGPAASLRVNIRAVAQYASESGNTKNAFNNVEECLRALEELDNLFLRASRNDRGASTESMKVNINKAVDALESLIQTVPPGVLEKGKAIADAYMSSDDEDTYTNTMAPEKMDPEIQQLESILS